MNFLKMSTACALIALTPAMASAGNLNANTAVEDVVMAPEEDDDMMMMGSLSSGLIIGGLALAVIALALNGNDDSTAGTAD